MSPPNLQMKAVEWKRLNSLLLSYETLFNSEQSFLLEVVLLYCILYPRGPKLKKNHIQILSLFQTPWIIPVVHLSLLSQAVEHVRFGQLNLAQNACISLADDCLNSNLK